MNDAALLQLAAELLNVSVKGTTAAEAVEAAVRAFELLGVRIASRNVLEDPELRDAIKRFSNWPTIPQVYIGGQFIGGSDIVREMYESGELEELVKKSQEA